VWPDRDGPSPHASDGASRFARLAIDRAGLHVLGVGADGRDPPVGHVHLQGPQRLSQMRQRVVWVSGLPSVKLAGRTLAGVGRAPHSRPRPRVAPGVAPVPKWGT